MPKVFFVRRAQKTRRKHGVKRGQPYYWWWLRPPGKFRGVKCYSPMPPKRSQLTLNPHKRAYWLIVEEVEHYCSLSPDGLPGIVEGVTDCLQRLAEFIDGHKNRMASMPVSLRESRIVDGMRRSLEEYESFCDILADGLKAISMSTDDEIAGVLFGLRSSLNCTPEHA